MNTDKLVNILWQGEFREAPAVFKKEGLYYILSSHCTGWRPNQGKVGYGKSMEESFSLLKNFGDETTFHSQPAFVLPVEKNGQTKYLYFADRWGATNDLYFTSSYVVLDIRFAGDPLLFRKNKWLLAHVENAGMIAKGVVPGIVGPNFEIKY